MGLDNVLRLTWKPLRGPQTHSSVLMSKYSEGGKSEQFLQRNYMGFVVFCLKDAEGNREPLYKWRFHPCKQHF